MRSSRSLLRLAFLAPAAAALLAGCARMEPPPGGPEDKTRPFVAGVYPAPGAVKVPRELDARIAFSEWVAKDAERGKVWLSPPTAKKLKVEYKGNVLVISSESPLDSGTTYVLGVAGTVKDLVGQPLEAPFQLVFSTGAALDTGTLEGRLSAYPGAAPAAGAFAALYPLEPALRARFAHLAARNAGKVPSRADSLPNPFREKPAYVAPADSLGRYAFQGVRPGRYMLLGFQDADQDASPDPALEPAAAGPAVTAAPGAAPGASLALSLLDTSANRLTEARWAHESMVAGRSMGTVRLKFAKPVHPSKALRRELYEVRRGSKDSSQGAPKAAGAAIPIMGIALHPETGEVELLTAPLEPESSYVVRAGAVPDPQGNLVDTSRNTAAFRAVRDTAAAAKDAKKDAKAGTAPDTSRAAKAAADSASRAADSALPPPIFLAPRRIDGKREKLPREGLIPSRGLSAYFPRILTDSLFRELLAKLEIKSDTVPVTFSISKVNHHEFTLKLGPVPLSGQSLSIGYRAPKPTAATAAPAGTPPAPAQAPLPGTPAPPGQAPAPGTKAAAAPAQAPASAARQAFEVADSAKLGSLQFLQDASARGAFLVLRALAAPLERAVLTPADKDEFAVDSLPAGWYAVDYFKDADRDSLWTPGRLRPWTSQEEFVHFADSVEVKPGGTSAAGPSGRRLAFPPGW